MPYEPKPGSAVAWNPKTDRQPLTIRCVAHRDIEAGEEFDVAIWPNREKKSETSPDHMGKVQDRWVPQSKQGSTGTDDGMPF